jgi:dTDP-L-rhamnose 4-epimerase
VIDVVIPVLDEEAALPWVLDRFPIGFRPIVVDNGSSDRSATIALEFGARVVVEPVRGFGSACRAGLHAATTDIVCFMDGDASLDPRDLPLVVAPLASADADLVLGARHAQRGAWPLHAQVANRSLAILLRRRGLHLQDLGPMRASRRTALLDLGIEDQRSGWPLEMVLRAARAKWSIAEVDVAYRPRSGSSKVTGTIRGTLGAVHDMARCLRSLPPG